MTAPTPILIDTGRSQTGWSFWGPAFLCDRLWYLINVRKKEFIAAAPLLQGTMGHLMLAHHFARAGAAQGGIDYEGTWVEDPSFFLEPEPAVRQWVNQQEAEGVECAEYLGPMLETFYKYVERNPVVRDRVVGVECLAKMTVGYNHDGAFGLWADDNLAEVLPIDEPRLSSPHPQVPQFYHGAPITVTKRFDLVLQSSRDGRTYIWDHKVTSGQVGAKRAEAYQMDGQFAVNRLAGDQMYNNFGGVMLNLVRRVSPWQVAEQFVPNTPWRDMHLPRQVYAKAHSLASRLADDMEGRINEGDWPMTQHELACYHRYGRCGAFDLCTYGG